MKLLKKNLDINFKLNNKKIPVCSGRDFLLDERRMNIR